MPSQMDDLQPCSGPESLAGSNLTFLYERLLRLRPDQIGEMIREGRCPPDRAFDRFLPRELQVLSSMHWTPLAVVLRAARWLDEHGVRSVVDVGSGAGKFVVAAALAGRCRFIGLEQRPRLVSAARELAALFEVEDRVEIVEGALHDTDLPRADAYYLFNPFGENLHGPGDCIDEDVELGDDRFSTDVGLVESLLEEAPGGTFLLTYNGFGGHVPIDFEEARVDRELPSVLRMWRKITREPAPRVSFHAR